MAREPKNDVVDNVILALDALTYDQLLTVADRATKLAETKKAQAKQALVAEFMARAQAFGLSLVETTGRRGRGPGRKASGSAPAARSIKFRDANGNSWVGVGPRPAWLKEALDKGATLDDFKV